MTQKTYLNPSVCVWLLFNRATKTGRQNICCGEIFLKISQKFQSSDNLFFWVMLKLESDNDLHLKLVSEADKRFLPTFQIPASSRKWIVTHTFLMKFFISLKLLQAFPDSITWGMHPGPFYHSAVFLCSACPSLTNVSVTWEIPFWGLSWSQVSREVEWQVNSECWLTNCVTSNWTVRLANYFPVITFLHCVTSMKIVFPDWNWKSSPFVQDYCNFHLIPFDSQT